MGKSMEYVFCIIPVGVYGKPPVAVCSTKEKAEELLRILEEKSDGYHRLYIVKVPVDEIFEIRNGVINWKFALWVSEEKRSSPFKEPDRKYFNLGDYAVDLMDRCYNDES